MLVSLRLSEQCSEQHSKREDHLGVGDMMHDPKDESSNDKSRDESLGDELRLLEMGASVVHLHLDHSGMLDDT